MKAYPLLKPVFTAKRTRVRNGVRYVSEPVTRSTQILIWLGRNGLRWMAGHPDASSADVATFLSDLSRRHPLSEVYPGMDEHAAAVKVANQISEAALWVVAHYDTEEREIRVERACHGQIKSLRVRRAKRDDRLGWLRDHPGTSAVEAAQQLGITRQQVYKLRAALPAWDLEQCFGPKIVTPAPIPVSVSVTTETDDWDLEANPEFWLDTSRWDEEPVPQSVEDDHLDEAPEPMTYEETVSTLEAERAADVAERSSSAAESFAQLVMDLLSTPAPIEPAGSSYEIDWDVEFAATKTRENPAKDDIADFIVNMPWPTGSDTCDR